MEKDFFDPAVLSHRTAARSAAEIQSSFINRVFGWMTAGLALTGVIAYFTAAYLETHIEALRKFGNAILILMVIEIVLVIGLSAAVNRISAALATAGFLLYAALNGVTLSVIFLAYTSQSVAATFFVTSGTFGALGLYGWLTKRDLTSIGSLCFMGLLGLIIASIVNMFFHNNTAAMVISWIGVLVFVGLTAYDAQKIKQLAIAVGDGESDEETGSKLAVFGALTLYLDFINLFLYLLRIFGRRR